MKYKLQIFWHHVRTGIASCMDQTKDEIIVAYLKLYKIVESKPEVIWWWLDSVKCKLLILRHHVEMSIASWINWHVEDEFIVDYCNLYEDEASNPEVIWWGFHSMTCNLQIFRHHLKMSTVSSINQRDDEFIVDYCKLYEDEACIPLVIWLWFDPMKCKLQVFRHHVKTSIFPASNDM